MKDSDGCKKEVMGSQQRMKGGYKKGRKNAQKVPKSRCKKCPKRLKMEEKEGSQQREKLAVK